MANAVVGHLGDRIGQQGMPVAVSPIDGQVRPMGVQLLHQLCKERTEFRIQWTDATEPLVVPGNLQQPIGRNIPSASHVFQKGITSSGPSGPPKETTRRAS